MGEVVLERVRKTYAGGVEAVREFTLAVGDGEFVVLVGPSGCGKSTTLRIVAGLEEADSGTVSIGGRVVNDVAPKDRDLAMVFQNYALYPHMDVYRNMAFALKLRRVSREEIDRRVRHAAKILEIEGLLKRKPRELSGGQRQRVAVGRAIVREPKAFLFDEPLSNLDAKLRVTTRGELKALHQRLRTTTLYVTHDQEEAMTLASRIGVMNRGEIVQVGTPSEIYEFPSTRFVADFIGSVNMFEGRLIEDLPDRVRISSPELGGVVYVDHGISAAPGANVWAAIRPEKITLSRAAPADASENCARGIVKEIAYMGDLSIYLVKIESGKMVRITMPNVERLAEHERILWDEQVYLSWHSSSPVVLTQ